jgi:hypothetical protein
MKFYQFLITFFLVFSRISSAAQIEQEAPYVASNLRLNITPGVGLVNSAPAWGGISAGLSFPISFPFYLGVETGYFTSVFTINNESGGTVVKSIPMLLTSRYFINAYSQSFRPFLGFNVGLNFVSGMGAYNIAGLKVSGDGTLVEVSLRPGFEFVINSNIQISADAKIGLIGENFLLVPELGVIFSI